MDYFSYKEDALFAEDLSVESLANEFGTPLYIYSRATLERHYKAYTTAFGDYPHLICYAVKANSNLAVLNVLAKLGAGFDIVSIGELERVIRAGGDPTKTVFSGVGKQVGEISRALDLGVYCFNVESEAELERIQLVASEKGQVAKVSLRVNPDVDAGTHPYISTGLKDNKFGIAIEDAERIYLQAKAMANLQIVGLDCHIGSQLTETAPFLDALDRLLMLIDRLDEQGISIRHLDLGGGLGVRYNDETPPEPSDYVREVLPKLKGRGLTIVMEPGRSIAANAGIMVTQVEFLKCNEHKNFAIVDAAMNDNLRPSLYGAWQDIVPVRPNEAEEEKIYDVVGPVCETGDFLGKERSLRIKAGDYLALRSSGAYGFVMSSNYNSRNRPAEVMVEGSRAHVVRRRETIEDQIGLEQVLPD